VRIGQAAGRGVVQVHGGDRRVVAGGPRNVVWLVGVPDFAAVGRQQLHDGFGRQIGRHVHDNAVHGACRSDDAGAIHLDGGVVGHGGLEDGQCGGVLAHVELGDEDEVVDDDRVGVGVVRAAGVPAGRAIDGVAAGGQVGDGILGDGVGLAGGGGVLADDHLVVAYRQHPHVNVLRGVEAGGEPGVDGEVDVLVLAVDVLDVLGGQAGVLGQDEVRHECIAVGEQVEVAAAVLQRDVVDGFAPERPEIRVEGVVVGPRAVVRVIHNGSDTVLEDEPRTVIANPDRVGRTNDEFDLTHVGAGRGEGAACTGLLRSGIHHHVDNRLRVVGRDADGHGLQHRRIALPRDEQPLLGVILAGAIDCAGRG